MHFSIPKHFPKKEFKYKAFRPKKNEKMITYYTYIYLYKIHNIILFDCTGSILYIFHPIGSFISGFVQETFGRKRCMIFANIPSILGWILLYYTHTTISLYTSTVMMGLSIGFSEAPILSYVGEITEPRLRGSMASLACSSCMVGSLITFVLGYYFPDWRTVSLLSTLCPLTCICLVLLVC